MSLRGPDVSGWQPGFEPWQVRCDFIICKATGGTSFTSPSFRKQADDALAAGKLLGVYHFAGDGVAGSAREEAEHFLREFEPYIGKAIPILDWEAEATAWPVEWAKEWLDIVSQRTGSTPWFYSYASYIEHADCRSIAHYPLWVAAYFAGYDEMGWQENPPYYGSYGDWDGPIAYQYTSSGTVGYPGHLDLNVFYGSAGDWNAMVADDLDPEEIWNYPL